MDKCGLSKLLSLPIPWENGCICLVPREGAAPALGTGQDVVLVSGETVTVHPHTETTGAQRGPRRVRGRASPMTAEDIS